MASAIPAYHDVTKRRAQSPINFDLALKSSANPSVKVESAVHHGDPYRFKVTVGFLAKSPVACFVVVMS